MNPINPIYKERDWLRDKYVMEEWSTTDIGAFCGVSHKTIVYWLNKHEIDARDSRLAQMTKSKMIKKQRKQDIADEKKPVFDPSTPSLRW